MKKLTATSKKRISQDWKSCFPGMAIYRPMHLLRRVEPLLLGILLESDSGHVCYRPTFHVHNLAYRFPVIALTLAQPLLAERTLAPESIDVQRHALKFQEAAARLSQQALLPLAGDLRLEEVLKAYRTYLRRHATRYQPELYADMIAMCAWTSETVQAVEILEEAKKALKQWPKDVVRAIGGVDDWCDRYARLIDKPESLQEHVAEEVEKFALKSIPVSNLLS